jgi:predicted nucleic acid-binding protein
MSGNIVFTIDSNLFIYALDARDATKHLLADRLLKSLFQHRNPLPLQCLSETYAVCARKKIADLATVQSAIHDSQLMLNIVPASQEDLTTAIELYNNHHLQFWDAMLLATAARSGCTLFLSEDMQDNRTYDTLTVRNPFTLSSAHLTTLLA